MSKKKFLLNGTTLLVSFYLSALFTVGLVFGYLVTNVFNKKIFKVKKGIFLNFWKWKIHLHHWIMGVLTFFSFYIFGWLQYIPNVLLGALSGFTLHDIFVDKKWHKIFYRKEMKILSYLKKKNKKQTLLD